MTAITHRDAVPADAAALSALATRAFSETFGHLYSADNLAAFLVNYETAAFAAEIADPAHAVRIVAEGEALVAYAKLGPPKLPFTPPDDAIELRSFYVLKPWHGSGIAADLIGWVLGEARRRDAASIYLSVFVDNHRARRFYERHGFAEIGRHAFMVGTHADEDIIMRRDL